MTLPLKTILALCLLAPGTVVFTPQARAQCATGVNTGGACVPPDAPGMPGYQGNTPTQQQAPPPRAVWADRWGAIAVDERTGQAGTIEGQESKSKANQIAISFCEKNGSRNCKVILAFHNQCAAVALYNGVGSGYSGGPTKDIAEKMAKSRCSHGDACKIVYSKCSYAERVR